MTHFWNHGEESLNNFIGEINQAHPTIKFTAEWSRESIFLFGYNREARSGSVVTDLCVKPTDTHQCLATNSCHPRHCKEAIPYSQALQMRRICSSDDTFRKGTTELKEHLTCHGYAQYSGKLIGPNTSPRKMPSHPKQRKQYKNTTSGIIASQPPTSDNPDTSRPKNFSWSVQS